MMISVISIPALAFFDGAAANETTGEAPEAKAVQVLTEAVEAAAQAAQEEGEEELPNSDRDFPPLPRPEGIVVKDKGYEADTDYMRQMILAAGKSDRQALDAAVTARNCKIEDLGLSYALLTTDQFLADFERYAGFALHTDYLTKMVQACTTGDYAAGEAAQKKRDLKIRTLGIAQKSLVFDELYWLSKIMYAEAGSRWLPDEWKMSVGEVVLNRVASFEFPNTIYDVIMQKGQYYGSGSSYFRKLKPDTTCAWLAVRLLQGERVLGHPAVVFQANFKQGSGVHASYYDKTLGWTYFCYSSRKHLY